MPIKNYNPTTPSRRNMSVSTFEELSGVKPEKSLLTKNSKNSGRNSYGRITVRHRGGGNRTKYRIIDFKRDKLSMQATVISIQYDPNRTAYIALVQYEDGEKRYILAPLGLKEGDKYLPAPVRTSSRGTRCRWSLFRWERLFIIWNCIPDAADS